MVAGNSAERQNEPHHVLIISQNAGMARVWKALFEQKNCRVVCATSPQEGISSSHTISPALILLDVNLPESERLNLCRELRSTTDGALLMLDASARNPDVLEYHRAGVDETVSASISLMALFIKSLTWLARQGSGIPR
ncbi:MAG: hypothetical protein DCC59_13505 [Chloroflexi bacterium]|nr:response regulator [Anaerolineales bacterium]RIK50452.1 MAG: hypothetical protein DCC59_13505 [Chloroflexota bacterium]